jgi:hypothetical protein
MSDAIETRDCAIANLTRETESLRTQLAESQELCEKLKLEAQIHAGEDDMHKTIVYEIYQALGIQKGDWNGARPVVEKFNELKAYVNKLREAVKYAKHYMSPHYASYHEYQEEMSAVLARAETQSLADYEKRIRAEERERCLDAVDNLDGYAVAGSWVIEKYMAVETIRNMGEEECE